MIDYVVKGAGRSIGHRGWSWTLSEPPELGQMKRKPTVSGLNSRDNVWSVIMRVEVGRVMDCLLGTTVSWSWALGGCCLRVAQGFWI